MHAMMDRRQAHGDRRWAKLNPHLGSDFPQHRDCLEPAASLFFYVSETREAVRKMIKSGTLGKLLITAHMIRETIILGDWSYSRRSPMCKFSDRVEKKQPACRCPILRLALEQG